MLLNVTSTEQTVYIFISDGGASVIVGDRGVDTPNVWEGGDMVSRRMFQLLGSPKLYFMHFGHVL